MGVALRSPGTAEKMRVTLLTASSFLGSWWRCSGVNSQGCREAQGKGSNRKRGRCSSKMLRSEREPAGLSLAAAGSPGDHGDLLRLVSGIFIRTAIIQPASQLRTVRDEALLETCHCS